MTHLQTNAVAIVNPAAGGGGAGRQWPSIAQVLGAAGVRVQHYRTTGSGQATVLAREALRAGYKTVIAVGGDGTVNEVANGFFDEQHRIINPEARFGLIPCGSSNDLARTLGQTSIRAATEVVLGGRCRPMDVGRVTCYGPGQERVTRHFLNVADLGMGGQTVRRMRTLPRLGNSTIMFLVAACLAVLSHRDVAARVCIDGDNEIAVELAILVVANARYFGGGMFIAPAARVDDGLADILWLGGARRRRLLLELMPRLYRGTHIGRPGVFHDTARTITVRTEGELLIQVDGELIGGACPEATFSMMAGAIQVLTSGTETVPSH